MIPNHTQFLDAIRDKKLIRVVFYSQPDAGKVDRECIPLDYGPEPATTDPLNRYWIWDHASTAGGNPLGLLSDQIVSVQVLGKDFDPEKLSFCARPWRVPRVWGTCLEPAGRPDKTTVARE
jgi:hypothetical protein